MKVKTRSLITILFAVTLLLIMGSITAFGADEGVVVSAPEGGEQSVTINSDITTETADALTVTADGEGSSAEVTVNGDIESDEGHGIVVSADGGDVSVTVDGEVEADEDALEIHADNGGNVTVSIDGELESDEDDGIDANADNGSSISVVVDGDVEAEEEVGLDLTVSGGSTIDVVVTGEVEGGDAGIVTNACTPGCDGTVNVTVWKVNVKENSAGTAFVALTDKGAVNSAFEKTINYIIRIADPDIISLPGLVKGKYGYTAHEGDVILVKLDVPDGREVEHVYADEDQELELIKGADGNYYVKVPKGGGVELSVELDDDDDDDDDFCYVAMTRTTPKTGDRQGLTLWSGIMLTAMMLLFLMLRSRLRGAA